MKPLASMLALLALFGCCLTAGGAANDDALLAEGRRAIPPAMPKRSIAPAPTRPAGMQKEIEDGAGLRFTLFIPAGYHVPPDNRVSITVHFHGATWFAIDEHVRRGLREPLTACYAGEGSSVYRAPFEDRQRLSRWLRLVEEVLEGPEFGGNENTRITSIDVSSFSAGYGAVREIVKSPEYVKLIRRIVLADSMYAGYAEPDASGKRAILPKDIEPWFEFARLAARGEKSFLLTHSQVPTGAYASSSECADAVIAAAGAKRVDVPRNPSDAATQDPDFPLLSRADLGHFHVWGYGGSDAQAHMTHPRHIAELWKALDAAEAGDAPATQASSGH